MQVHVTDALGRPLRVHAVALARVNGKVLPHRLLLNVRGPPLASARVRKEHSPAPAPPTLRIFRRWYPLL
jgi:hypothetical protein